MTPKRVQPLPVLHGIPKQAADELRTQARMIQRLQARIDALEGAGFLTKQAADPLYGPAVMAQELSSSGSAPLNVVTVSGRSIIQAQPTRGRK